MIDPDLLESYPREIRDSIREAILVLATTGVLEAQRQRLFARVAEGSDNEEEKVLGDKILSYRKQSHALIALQQMGESIKMEIDNEREE